jgi:AcrR family transcriptional regulator
VAAGRTTRATRAAAGATVTGATGRGLRRQGEATRDKLLAAAVPALSESGYHATRVDDVVRLAGVSHGTFYLYFTNMEDLFRALAEKCADDAAALAESLGAVPGDGAGQLVLRAWLAEFLAFYRRYGVVIRAWAENQVTDRELSKLGAVSFGRIATTLRSSIGALDDGPGRTGAGGRATRTKAARARQVELRADALLALLERFSYVVTSRDLGWDDEVILDHLSVLVHRGFFQAAH